MPGIAGFIRDPSVQQDGRHVLADMQDYLTYDESYVRDELFCDESVCATRSHIGVIEKEPQPYHKSGVFVWLDGELFNRGEVAAQNKTDATTDPELILSLYEKDRGFSFLKHIDGFYSSVIYDSNRQIVHLISDRYGMRYLYRTVRSGRLAWSSEVKALLAIPEYVPVINPEALDEFINIGYLLENRTWLEGIEMLAPGSVLSWNIKSGTAETMQYWWWDSIKPIDGRIDEDDVVDELGRLFRKAVEKRCEQAEDLGVTLSGGLDSRAVLAAIPESDYPIHTATFGITKSGDIQIARKASSVKGAIHHPIEINHENWLAPRITGVWTTDGQTDLMHMHGIEAVNEMKNYFRINNSGFAGDLILGGSYLIDERFPDSNRKELLAEVMGCNPSCLWNYEAYSSLGKPDYYFLQNRVRRFTCGGTKLLISSIEYRKPFLDNRLMEFAYSLPDSMRYKNHIYNKMLLRSFPEYFKNIPWLTTGVPISWPDWAVTANKIPRKTKSVTMRMLNNAGFNMTNTASFTDYPRWIRIDPARSFFEEMLAGRQTLYPQYLDEKKVRSELEAHMNGRDFSKSLCRYLTIEIWLRQLFEKEFRPAGGQK